MDDYISREAAIKAAKCHYPKANEMIAGIILVPAADVRPVVRAHWEIYQAIGSFCLNGDFDVLSWQCSECGGISSLRTHYCPHCGADMMEDKGDYKDV